MAAHALTRPSHLLRVAAPPSRPTLVYDANCTFCRSWVLRWRQLTGKRVEYLPAQSVRDRFPEIPPESFARGVQFVERDGRVHSNAAAALRALSFAPRRRWLWWSYRWVPGFARISERIYRVIANHRSAAAVVTRLLWGGVPRASTYVVSGWLFPRILGGIYLIAFVSLWTQLRGLIGDRGITPLREYFPQMYQQLGTQAYWKLPSVLWFSPNERSAQQLTAVGCGLSVLAMAGIAPGICLSLLWLSYLSLSVACGDFLAFQWDILLLETGFLALFLAPWRMRAPLSRAREPWVVGRLLLWFLLWRLMVASGAVKLTSGDPAWRDLSALTFHYETQPLPTPVSWWLHQAPPWFHATCCLLMYVVELGVPFLIFAPRRLRLFAAGALVAFQGAIEITGNYGFFNVLTAALCIPLIDDAAWPRALRQRASSAIVHAFAPRSRWPLLVFGTVATATAVIASVAMLDRVVLRRSFAHKSPLLCAVDRTCAPVRSLEYDLSPLRTINAYGLFEVMTRPREEIIIEGSSDGDHWRAYEFTWKPGDPWRAPRFVAPHMPRLDWLMWFAVFGDVRQSPWFPRFALCLLKGEPTVTALLERNPFPEEPPKFLRAFRFRYRFSTIAEHRSDGSWWKREQTGVYLPSISLR